MFLFPQYKKYDEHSLILSSTTDRVILKKIVQTKKSHVLVFVIDNILQRYAASGSDLIKDNIEVSACMFTGVAFDHHKLNIPNLNLVDVIRNPSLKCIAVNAFSKLMSLLVRHAKENEI